MKPPISENSKIAEEAAWWLHRLKHGNTPEAQAAFREWIRKGSAHLEEYLFAQAVWRELDGIDPGLRVRYDSAAATGSIVPFPEGHETSQRSDGKQPVLAHRRLRMRFGLAAGVVALAAGILGWTLYGGRAHEYVTAVGEQRAIKLIDGSVMHLNTRSRAEVHYTNSIREIRLLEGQALFTAERDAKRPFVVATDTARVRALGTQFDVYRRQAGETRVAVVDGAVRVTWTRGPVKGSGNPEVRLAAGDEAEIADGKLEKNPSPDVRRAVAWQARQLMFSGRPVAEIVQEFNRYNAVQIRVEGKALEERRMSGVFAADDPEPFLGFLAKEPGVAVERTGETIVIRGRGELE